jgi:branched-chain amino acid transport system substrate-binding protein
MDREEDHRRTADRLTPHRRLFRNIGLRVSGIVALGLVIIVSGCGGSDDSDAASSEGSGGGSSESVKVGFIADETGALAPLGTSYKRGFDTAVSLWNGDDSHGSIETEACDSQSTGPGALSCYQRLKDAVDAISGPHLFLGVAAIKEIASAGSVPVMSAAPVADPAADSQLYQSVPTIADGVEAGLQHLKDKGMTRVALLTSNDTPGTAAASAAKELASSMGVTLVANEVFDPTAQSLAAQAENIGRTDPQAVLAWTAGPQLITALRALQSARVNVPVMLNYASMSVPLLTQAGDAAGDNLLFFATQAFDPSSIDDAAYRQRVEQFVDAYTKANKAAPDFTAFVAADTANILGAAAADSVDTIADTLQNGEPIDGVLFPSYTFTDQEHIGLKGGQAFTILRWQPAEQGWTVAD